MTLTDVLRFLRKSRRMREFAWESCEEVAQSVEANETKMHGPIQAYVVNFGTTSPYPYKFLSAVCTNAIEKGRRSRKSLEFGAHCDHDSSAKCTFTDHVYRFDVILVDVNHNGDATPIRCTISKAASKLLDVPVTVFREWTEEDQTEYVRDIVLQTPICEFYLKVRDGKVTAHIFYIYDPVPKRTLPLRPREAARPSLPRSISCVSWLMPGALAVKDKGKGKQKVVEESDEGSDEPGPDGRLAGASSAQLGGDGGSGPLARTSSSKVIFSKVLNKPIYEGSCSKYNDKIPDQVTENC